MPEYVEGSLPPPAAATDLSFIPAHGNRFVLTSLRAQLVTSATVASRVPHFQIVNASGQVLHEITAPAAQTATTTITYDLCARNGAPFQGSAVVDGVAGITLPDLWWPAGTQIKTATTAIASGDQWGSIYWTALVGDEWEILQLLAQLAKQAGD